MLLLELTTLASSMRSKKLGLSIDDEDMIEVKTSINIDHITHLTENPDNNKLTNIYLSNGGCLITPYSFLHVRSILDSDDVASDINTNTNNNVEY